MCQGGEDSILKATELFNLIMQTQDDKISSNHPKVKEIVRKMVDIACILMNKLIVKIYSNAKQGDKKEQLRWITTSEDVATDLIFLIFKDSEVLKKGEFIKNLT
jgi:hypothetical protein